MNADDLNRLMQLRPTLTGIVGFYRLLCESGDQRPEDRMVCEAYFATDALRVAKELLSVIDAELDRPKPDDPPRPSEEG